MIIAISLLLIASIAIWLSTKYAIESVEKIASKTRIAFVPLSLLVIGVVTSIPEVTITINSLLMRAPQIALGNLIGSQIFLLFAVVPLLAIVSRGLHLQVQMKGLPLALLLTTVAVPMVALLDQTLVGSEVVLILCVYAMFFFLFTRQSALLDRTRRRLSLYGDITPAWEAAVLVGALSILFLASNTAVRQLIEIAALLQTPRFLLSLLILPISTNLPELSLALGSLRAGKRDVALGDFMGTLTFNSLILGVLVLSLGATIVIGQSIGPVIVAFLIGLVVFWVCSFSKKILSVREGLLLLFSYVVLLCTILWVIIRTRVLG